MRLIDDKMIKLKINIYKYICIFTDQKVKGRLWKMGRVAKLTIIIIKHLVYQRLGPLLSHSLVLLKILWFSLK